MTHKVNPKLVPKGYAAVTILPWLAIYASHSDMTERNKRHENIHGRQQAEMFILFFYLAYAMEYLILRIFGKNHLDAYSSISFEREAYDNDHSEDYLKKRKCFAWIKYCRR